MTGVSSPGRRVASALVAANQSIPREVINSARLHLLDAVGVGVVAGKRGPVAGVNQIALSETSGVSSVLGRSEPASVAMAALINGTLIHSLEFDDTHVASVMHGSSVLASTAIAIAESEGTTVESLVSAFATGWEFLIRIGLASPGRIQANGFQITSAGGAFASAAISCLLSQDSTDVMSNAIGIAGSQAAGTFAFLAEGNTVKAVQPGWAAHAGILAAELARSGVTGPSDVFRGKYGFYSLYARDDSGGDRLLKSIQDLGTRWYLPEAAFKLIPSCHYIHPFVEAVERAVASGLNWTQMENLHAWIPAEVTAIIADPWESRVRPNKSHDARWSLPYVLAAVLIDGPIGVELFTGECRSDVMQLAERMTFEPWANSGYPERYPARIQITDREKRIQEFTVLDVKGGAGRPIESVEVIGKAQLNLHDAGWSDERVERFIHVLLHESDTPIGEFSSLLRANN